MYISSVSYKDFSSHRDESGCEAGSRPHLRPYAAKKIASSKILFLHASYHFFIFICGTLWSNLEKQECKMGEDETGEDFVVISTMFCSGSALSRVMCFICNDVLFRHKWRAEGLYADCNSQSEDG